MSDKNFYLTTPIYYVNDVPHVGNAYTTIIADIIKRYNQLIGNEAFLLTGTDENAPKVAAAAVDKGLKPQEFVDQLAEQFKNVWDNLGINYDDFIRTTEPRHKDVVQKIFSRLLEQGDIYKGDYQGWYCVPCETFWLESDLVDGKCPNAECGRTVEWVEEENYYFRLSAYSEKLLDYIEQNPKFLQPEFRKNEVVGFIKQGLRDVSITRKNNGWGIEVPGDPGTVIYVWFDALINYISAIGYLSDDEKFNKFWPADLQLMGKDIFVRFHCTFWPAMLMALNLELPETLFGHGFWTINGEKISKSKGNAISPSKLAVDLAEESGADKDITLDVVRYFLAREVTFGLDGDFSIASFKNRFNSDLANDLGNLLNRTLGMLGTYREFKIPSARKGALSDSIKTAAQKAKDACDALMFTSALESIWEMINIANKFIQDKKPWEMHKTGNNKELDDVLFATLQVARAMAIMISPFMPSTAQEIARQLGLKDKFSSLKWDNLLDENPFAGVEKTENPAPIFPRLNNKPQKQEKSKVEETQLQEAPKPQKVEDTINYEYFSKLKFRVAEVLTAEKVEGADKLLKLQVSLGDEERQIVAGVAQYYAPEDMVGRKIVMLTNLEPAKIRGVVSNGMLIAADVDGRAVILTPESDVPAGSKIK